MRNLNFLADLDAFTAQPVHFNKNVHRSIVPEGFYGILYRHGQYRHRLAPGKHRFWRRGYDVRLVDMRKITLTVAGQDVLTADNLNVKLSALVNYQVLQPEKALHDVQDYQAHLYNVVQLAIRSVVAGAGMDALLGQRLDIGKQLLPLVQPEADKIGLRIDAVEIKDVMLPAEPKKAYGEVLRARQEGQAALERARGESAALRNLANAARLMENNPALMNLRLIQSLSAAQASGNTLVMGVPGAFVPLKNGQRRDDTPGEAE